MKKFLCWLRGHKLVLEVHNYLTPRRSYRLKCLRCGLADPYTSFL